MAVSPNILAPDTYLQNGRYRILRFIASGGFGCTYLAEHTALRKQVAIKEFFPSTLCNRDFGTKRLTVGTESQRALVEKLKRKFADEARTVSALKHSAIVNVTDIFEENDTQYFVMDLIEGQSLHQIVETHGALDEAEALRYIRQVAEALQYVHSHNILHLDIKPSNIIVDHAGNATLIDFGAAKQYDEANGENTSTLLGKTPGYAPPEQMSARVSKFYPATDIYALGATLYKLLCGNTPPDAAELSSGVEELAPLPEHISDATRRAVKAAMMVNVRMRPQSVDEFLAILDTDTSGTTTNNDATRIEASTNNNDATQIEERHSNSGERNTKQTVKQKANPWTHRVLIVLGVMLLLFTAWRAIPFIDLDRSVWLSTALIGLVSITLLCIGIARCNAYNGLPHNTLVNIVVIVAFCVLGFLCDAAGILPTAKKMMTGSVWWISPNNVLTMTISLGIVGFGLAMVLAWRKWGYWITFAGLLALVINFDFNQYTRFSSFAVISALICMGIFYAVLQVRVNKVSIWKRMTYSCDWHECKALYVGSAVVFAAVLIPCATHYSSSNNLYNLHNEYIRACETRDVESMQLLAEGGQPNALETLGDWYHYGLTDRSGNAILDIDDDKAYDLYRRAAALGMINAAANAGDIIINREANTWDEELNNLHEAERLYQQALHNYNEMQTNGAPEGCFNIGWSYYGSSFTEDINNRINNVHMLIDNPDMWNEPYTDDAQDTK